MELLHALLRRQLKRHLGAGEAIPDEWRALLDAVNAAYHEFDSGRLQLERALDLSSRELFQANAELRGVLLALPDRLFRIVAGGGVVDLTRAGARPFPLPWAGAGGSDAARRFWDAVDAVRETKAAASLEYQGELDGRGASFEARLLPFVDQDIIAIVRDVTERRAADEALRQQRAFLRSVIDTDPNFIFVKDGAGRYVLANQAVAEAYGTTPEGMVGRCDADFNPNPDEVAQFRRADQALLAALEKTPPYEECVTDAQGRQRWLQTVKQPIYSPETRSYHVLGICADITARKQSEDQLAHQAFHDALTGLPNRALFMERVRHALERARRSGAAAAVVFLDLDNFKLVNDSLGHDAGDDLLTGVAARLLACVRPGDTVARLGGDEFTLLLEDLADPGEAVRVAERVTQSLQRPIAAGSREVFTSGSLGVAVSAGQYPTPDALLRDADTAMYQAKTAGKAACVVFDPSMNSRAVERLDLETGLRRALERGELRVHYQPIIALPTGAVSEFEALVRWEHPDHGLIPPAKFIALAEETGMIVPLGRWVLREACRQAHLWHRAFPQDPPLTISVNLSSRQLQQADIVAQVQQALAETGLSGAHLKLEITESVMMQDLAATLPLLHALKGLGIRLAVDDFGTGYSSMAYLSRLPIDTLKVDRAFVSKMGEQEEDDAIVRAIVGLAGTLGLRVTAEGVETGEQLSRLSRLGCGQGQGYYFSRPLDGVAAGQFLAAHRAGGRHHARFGPAACGGAGPAPDAVGERRQAA